MKKFLFYLRLILWDIPLWIPYRIRWKWRRGLCKKYGCAISTLYEEGKRGVTLENTVYCTRCQAYESFDYTCSEYPLMKNGRKIGFINRP